MEIEPGETMTVSYDAPKLELKEQDGVVSFRDDFPCYGPLAQRLNSQQKNLIDKVFPTRGIVTDGTTYYLYSNGTGSWAQLYSKTAAFELLDITRINAPVNYANALGWAYALLKRIALPVRRVHPSVCIGTYRLMFMCDYHDGKFIVHYRPHWPVIDNRGMDPMYNRIYSFVVSPILFPSPVDCPYRVEYDWEDRIINTILLPLRYDQRLDFLWRVGKAIINPVKNPSVIVLYGRYGHEGKTELAKNLTKLLPDAVEWVSEDLFGKTSKWPDADVVMNLCEKRILVCDECKIQDGFNYDHIKRWTSEAPNTGSNGMVSFLSQTCIVISNNLPFYEKAAMNNSVGRRLVIYHMTKKMTNFKPIERSDMNNNVSLKFISLAVSTAIAHDYAPTSLPIALFTNFRKNTNKITAGLVYDVASSRRESVAATCVMAMRCGIPASTLCAAFQAASPLLVEMPERGCPYIKSIRVRLPRLTAHGQEYVDKRAQANVKRYDLEAMLERGMVLWKMD